MAEYPEGTNPNWNEGEQQELRRCLTTMFDADRAEWLMRVRDAVGDCDLCGEPVLEYEQAEVVEIATGIHYFAHAEGCHDAAGELESGPEYQRYAFA